MQEGQKKLFKKAANTLAPLCGILGHSPCIMAVKGKPIFSVQLDGDDFEDF
jgi:hypothetical protein